MTPIDLTKMSSHFINDRKGRINLIEKTIGWGEPIVEVEDHKGRDATTILTTSGVLVVRDLDNMIITAWIASERQAMAVYRKATGKREMPKDLFWTVQYNNNSTLWQKKAAA